MQGPVRLVVAEDGELDGKLWVKVPHQPPLWGCHRVVIVHHQHPLWGCHRVVKVHHRPPPLGVSQGS